MKDYLQNLNLSYLLFVLHKKYIYPFFKKSVLDQSYNNASEVEPANF